MSTAMERILLILLAGGLFFILIWLSLDVIGEQVCNNVSISYSQQHGLECEEYLK